MSYLWKYFQDKLLYEKTFEKKFLDFFWFVVRDFNISDILQKTLIFFGTQSTSLPPGGQQPALPSHLQSVPKPAQQLGPSSCLPHGCQQLTLPGHLKEATQAALLPGRSSCLPPGGQQLVIFGHLLTAPRPAQLPGRSSCLPPNG